VPSQQFDLRLGGDRTETDVLFSYPRALGLRAYGGEGHVASVVRLEVGARSDHHPTREVDIRPYSFELAPDLFRRPTARVVAQAPERTLLEKAFIMHTGICKDRLPSQSSRHAYDLAMMQRAGIMESVTRELFEEVARHKFVFSDDKHASLAPEGGIKMVPQGELRSSLESDYRGMGAMFFEAPPLFSEILGELYTLETVINSLTRG